MSGVDKTSEQIPSLRQAAVDVVVTAFVDYREYLQALYTWQKKHLKRYSYLQFAVDLGFSKSNVVHLIVTGKRPLTIRAAAKVLAALGLKGNEKRYFEALVLYANGRTAATREELFQEILSLKNRSLKSALAKNQLEFFAAWYHPVILEMTRMPSFNADPEIVAQTLRPRIRPTEARKSLELLAELGLTKRDPVTGQVLAASTDLTTGDEIHSIAVVRYHQKMIELGKESITTVDEAERDVSAITVCVSAKVAAEMKHEVQAFRKRLLAMAEDAVAFEVVYQVNIQLFPVTGKR